MNETELQVATVNILIVDDEPKNLAVLESVLDSPVARQVGRTAASMITRSLLGALGLGGKSKKSSSWF